MLTVWSNSIEREALSPNEFILMFFGNTIRKQLSPKAAYVCEECFSVSRCVRCHAYIDTHTHSFFILDINFFCWIKHEFVSHKEPWSTVNFANCVSIWTRKWVHHFSTYYFMSFILVIYLFIRAFKLVHILLGFCWETQNSSLCHIWWDSLDLYPHLLGQLVLRRGESCPCALPLDGRIVHAKHYIDQELNMCQAEPGVPTATVAMSISW